MRTQRKRGWRRAVGLMALALLGSGCGSRDVYPVEGQVVDQEGKPVTGLQGATVEFESAENRVSASGDIQEDGRFRMTTHRPGDGAVLGRHRVLISRPYFGPEKPAPRVIHRKYEGYDSSGLEVTVEPKKNFFTLTVERVGPGKGGGR